MKNKSRKNQDPQRVNQAGFTLIELILYIGLISIFLSGAIMFAWDIIYGQVRARVQRDVSQNLRVVSQRINYEIRNASAINSVSANSISLGHADPAHDPTVIDLNAGQVRVGYGSGGSCPATNPCPLSSQNLTVTQLEFTDLSMPPDSFHIAYQITIESNGARVEWQKTKTFSSSAELRTN